jgi:hypothetical protein
MSDAAVEELIAPDGALVPSATPKPWLKIIRLHELMRIDRFERYGPC